MADAQTQESDQTPFRLDPEATADWRRGVDSDIGSLVGMPDKQSIDKLTSGLHLEQYIKAAKTDALSREFDENAARNKAYRDEAFRREGVAANELLPPWDAEKEHKRFETNPIEGFGSMGGLFAVLASAFTKAPMENAINGMAGAINAIKEGNEAGYKRAFESYKENVKLAEQRFKMQHELYEDALSLGTADIAASQAKFHNAAIRFGDRKALMLMENGLYPELYEYINASAKAMEQVVKSNEAIDLHTVQKAAVDSLKMNPPKTGDLVQDKMLLARQVQLIYDGEAKAGTAQQQAVMRYIGDPNNLKKNSQEFINGLAEINERFGRTADIDRQRNDYIAQRWQAYRDAHGGQDPPAEEQANITREAASLGRGPRAAGGAGATNKSPLTIDRQIKADADEHKAQMLKEHGPGTADPWTPAQFDKDYDDYIKHRRTESAGLPATRADELKGRIDQANRVITQSKTNLEFLRTYKGGSGLLGKIMRGVEIGENIAGISDQSDRGQFRRRVLELQDIVPRVLTDSNGRPLASAQAKVDQVVAGLNAGDTGPQTIRAYTELIEEMQERIGKYEERLGQPPTQTEAPIKKRPWESAPLVGGEKHSSAYEAPPVTGARQAPDGEWYISDPKRPGKYLQVQIG